MNTTKMLRNRTDGHEILSVVTTVNGNDIRCNYDYL